MSGGAPVNNARPSARNSGGPSSRPACVVRIRFVLAFMAEAYVTLGLQNRPGVIDATPYFVTSSNFISISADRSADRCAGVYPSY
jgi:hypothetical protein